jgi:hypothetical protein
VKGDWEELAMTQTQVQPRPRIRRLLITAAVLETTAGVLGLAGLALCTVAVTVVARHRVARMEVSPGELARRNMSKAKVATAAGVNAWRGGRSGASAAERADGLRRSTEMPRVALGESSRV